ncbi:MAG: hypothetical protein WBP45_11655 [Daejeonella sp.]
MTIYHASFIEIFYPYLGMLVILIAVIFILRYSIKHGPAKNTGRSMNSDLYQNYKITTRGKWRIRGLQFAIFLISLLIFILSYRLYSIYSEGISKLISEIAHKKITKSIKHHSPEYLIESSQIPGMYFQVNKETFEHIKINCCYEIEYYGTLSYYPPLKEIQQIKELKKCN